MSQATALIGCVQLNSQQNIEDNLNAAESAIADASRQGVKLVVLPENMMSMGKQHELAQQFDELSATFASFAERYNIYILAGTLPCAYRPCGTTVPNNRLRQVSQMFDPGANCIARYDKIHLFQAQVADAHGSYDETQIFEAGDTLSVAQCELDNSTVPIPVGMMVCFDLRFAALAQRLRSFGAQILTAPAAFTYQTGQAHWQLLLRARALDAQCMVVGAAQGGKHHYSSGKSRHTWGHSSITYGNGSVAAHYQSDTLIANNLIDNKLIANKLSTTQIKAKSGNQSKNKSKNEPINYALITANFDAGKQYQWRQDLPIQRCHRLG